MSVIADALRQAAVADSPDRRAEERHAAPGQRRDARALLGREVRYPDASVSPAADRAAGDGWCAREWFAALSAVLAASTILVSAAVFSASPQDVVPAPVGVNEPPAGLPPRVALPVEPPPSAQMPSAIVSDAGAVSRETAAEYRLSGIMRGDGGLWAVINGVVVRVGDSVDGADIVALEPTGARIRVGVREVRLHLVGGRAPENSAVGARSGTPGAMEGNSAP